MARVTAAEDASYSPVQLDLFHQILTTVRRAMSVLIAMSLVALAVPSLRILPVFLLGLIPLLEFIVTLISGWLIERQESRKSAFLFVFGSLFLASMAAAVLNLSTFAALCAAVLMMISAVLIGYRSVVMPAVIGFLAFLALHLGDQAGWLRALQFKDAGGAIVAMQIGFVAAVLGIMSGVSWVSSERLQRSSAEALLRATQAEEARGEQIALNQQLTAQVAEQQRLLDLIQELEVPTIPIQPGMVVLPLVGHLDPQRLERIEQRLLRRIRADNLQVVLADVTGISEIDAAGAEGLHRLAVSVQILGARIILTGLQPSIARTLVALSRQAAFPDTAATIADALDLIGKADL